MKQKLQVVENYITKYDFKIKRKILSNEELSIDFGVGYKILKVFEKNTNQKNKDRYHLLDKYFTGDSCWYECLSWIKNR